MKKSSYAWGIDVQDENTEEMERIKAIPYENSQIDNPHVLSWASPDFADKHKLLKNGIQNFSYKTAIVFLIKRQSFLTKYNLPKIVN